MRKRPKVPPPLAFPPKPHCRVHGPAGHKDYRKYKPWLRDEFEFRCVYCLTRERWRDEGYKSFTADHVKPKSIYEDEICEYDNLVYCCALCNSYKSTILGLPDPCKESIGDHLKQRSGRFIHKTPEGRRLIEYLRLNQQERVDHRLIFLGLYSDRKRLPADRLERAFGDPKNLPDLSTVKPRAKANSRPAGVASSHYARQKAGKLPPYY